MMNMRLENFNKKFKKNLILMEHSENIIGHDKSYNELVFLYKNNFCQIKFY